MFSHLRFFIALFGAELQACRLLIERAGILLIFTAETADTKVRPHLVVR
jgi:hypothetical protein